MSELASLQVKGLALEPTVAAIRPAFERSPELVEEALRGYFAEPIDAAKWYPAPDYLALVRVMGSLMDIEKCKGDPYRAVGIIGARRDIGGDQPAVPQEQRSQVVGAFSGVLSGVTGLATLVRRSLHLRERYYSRGYYKVKRTGERSLLVTLHDFPAAAELCSVSTGYLISVFRHAVPGTWVERLSCRGRGDDDCRWELRFGADTDVTDLKMFE